MVTPSKLTPINRFVACFGMIPSSYKEAMTYEEQLVWLCNYLETEILPAINNNADGLSELQGLYVQLKDYVDNYFDNLDIQQEVSNKIDDMVESGQLQEIITSYLAIKGVLGFNTVADMKAGTNFIDGSIAKTLGSLTYNDGEGAFYYIRDLKNTDVIDEINILAITNYPDLVAEKIKDKAIEDLELYKITNFDTVVALKAATTLQNGSSVKTLGYTTKNDGGTASYKIRTATNEDEPDEGLLIELQNDLVAELVVNDYVTPEMFGAVGDGNTDDTTAFINAINSNYRIIGTSNKTYKIDKIVTEEDINISNCSFFADPEQSATDVRFLFRTYSYNVKFDNCKFTSSLSYLPVINQINGLNQGLASNVIAIRAEHGAEVTNCKFTTIYAVDSRGKTTITNCNFDNVEMGVLVNTDSDTIIENCNFIMSRLTDGQYYHAMYVQASNRFIANNIYIKENGEGGCGDHLHFKHPTLNTTTTPNAIISNCIIDGDLSFTYISQNNNAKLKIDNLTYKGTTGGVVQTGQSGTIEIINSTLNSAGEVIFDCYNSVRILNSIINGSNSGGSRITNRANLFMYNTTINSVGELNMSKIIGSLTTDIANCIFNAPTVNSLNSGGNGIVNNIVNCTWNLSSASATLNLAGRGYTSGIIRAVSYPTAMGTVADHNGYDFVVYRSNTYFNRLTNINTFA